MRRTRIAVWGIVLLTAFGVLCGRIAYLMLVQGEDLAARAQAQHSRTFAYYQYARGDIVDRQGRNFTSSNEACVIVLPSSLRNLEETAARLAEILEFPQNTLYQRLESGKQQQYSPYIFKTGLSNAQAEAVRTAELPGVFVLQLAARYNKAGSAAHVIGQLKVGEHASQMVGSSGIELQYEDWLQGRQDTQVVAQVDATGRLSSEDWYLLEPQQIQHNNVQLTLDLDYQQIAERALGEQAGACVILDPQTGDILAAVSSPGFDAYGWQAPQTQDVYVNKAFAFYPPASTFKMLLALAAMDSGLPIAMQDFVCEGSTLVAGQHNLNCWNRSGHGAETLAQALAGSCNPYFATLGWEMGERRLRFYFERCGLAQQQILGYPAAMADSTFSYHANVAGDVANVSIGENGVRLSPLLVAQLTAICANGGLRVYPRLVERVVDAEGAELLQIEAQEPQRAVGEQAALAVADMLRLAVTEGTLSALQSCLLPCAAKTGTAEDAGVWCSGFAPYLENAPQAACWAVAVYVEDGVTGSREAAAVFKRILNDIALLEGLAEAE